MAWLNFLDLRSLPVKEAEAVILPIPYEATTTYGAGTRQGPEAILAASRQVELWDEDFDWDPSAAIRLATEKLPNPASATVSSENRPSQIRAAIIDRLGTDSDRNCSAYSTCRSSRTWRDSAAMIGVIRITCAMIMAVGV